MMKWKRPVIWLLLAVAVIATVVSSFTVQVYRDRGFICENTGSRRGFRQWICGIESGHWYEQSPLEAFIVEHDPDALEHRWTSYAGTGKNLFGISLQFGHGSPGAILDINHDVLSRWIADRSAEEVCAFYDLLVSDDQNLIRKRIPEINDEVWQQ